MHNFVNEIADCQYSQDSIFWIIIASKAKYAYFGHFEADYEMINGFGFDK